MSSARHDYPRASADDGEERPLLGDQEEPASAGRNRSSAAASFVQRIITPLKNPETLRPLERVLLVVSLVLLLLFAVFVGLYAGAQARLARNGKHGGHGVPGHDGGDGGAVCTTPHCVLTASELLHSIDSTVDPCDDFYTFTVGTWLKEHPIPGDAGLYGMAQKIGADNARLLHKYLVKDEDDQPPVFDRSDEKNLHKLRAFYSSCMDGSAQNKAGAAPLVEMVGELRKRLYSSEESDKGTSFIDELAGGLAASSPNDADPVSPFYAEDPIPPNRPPSRHPPTEKPSPLPPRGGRQVGLTAALAWAHSQGLPALFAWSVDGDPVKDPKMGTAYLDPEGLGFPDKAYYSDKDEVAFYEKQATEAMIQFSAAARTNTAAGSNKKQLGKLARAVVEFEADLAKITPDGEDLEDPIATYNPTTLTSLTYKFSALDWPTYLSALTHRVPKAVIVRSPEYIKRLDALVSRTKTQVLEAYLAWTIIRSLGLQLGPDVPLRKPIDALDRRSKGVAADVREDRDTACFAATNEALGNLAGHFYVQDAFSDRARGVAAGIIDNIIAAFKSRLPELAWLDPKTRRKAETKANAIRIKVGWPLSPNTTDAEAMDEYYSDLQIKNKDYFGNVARSRRREAKRSWAGVGRQLDPKRWDMIPSEVNAYYNPGGNEIVFPAGILQPQYFSEFWPAYLQYGAFGNVAGHELSHAFDPAGRLFDEDGRLRDWWTNDTAQAFNKRRDCLVDQYGNYTVPDGKGGQQNLRSRFTIGEDVADAGGMAQSYRAWRDTLEKGGQTALDANPLLPGLDYTREQLFFIAFGIGWARNIRTQEAIRRLRTDEHSPTKYRVIGTLSNNRDFARAFGCTAGKDRMARSDEERCEIW